MYLCRIGCSLIKVWLRFWKWFFLSKRLRLLENRLNKAELKHNEALTIQRTYNQIKAHLLQESLSYSNRLDELEKQIEISNEELKKLKVINKDAFVAKENASNEFSKFEDKVYK